MNAPDARLARGAGQPAAAPGSDGDLSRAVAGDEAALPANSGAQSTGGQPDIIAETSGVGAHAGTDPATTTAPYPVQPIASAGRAAEELSPACDEDLELLREILLDRQRRRIADLQAELNALEARLDDPDALANMIAPALSEAIRVKLRDSQDEMIESLYPIIGRLVVRAVSEAIRDLARSIDARLRQSLNFRSVWQRLWARLRGVSASEFALRSALPFEVTEVFLVHRETGLLLHHASRGAEEGGDSELISSMLTAIRDFAHDTFGQGHEGQLDEIQYGDRRILIEASQHAYLAVVVDGIEPPGFRANLRDQLMQVEQDYGPLLRRFDGNAARFAVVETEWRATLLAAAQEAPASAAGESDA